MGYTSPGFEGLGRLGFPRFTLLGLRHRRALPDGFERYFELIVHADVEGLRPSIFDRSLRPSHDRPPCTVIKFYGSQVQFRAVAVLADLRAAQGQIAFLAGFEKSARWRNNTNDS